MAYYGYIRVSTDEQNTGRQRRALKEYEQEHGIKLTVYGDKASGKNFQREHYQELRTIARQGDIIIIKELDRLGRNYEEIKQELSYFKTKGVKVRILDMPILDVKDETLSALLNNLMIELLSYIAQKEREKIVSRVREGVANAMENGTKSGRPFGRPAVVLPDSFVKYYGQMKTGQITKVEFAKLLQVGRRTIYRWIEQFESQV